MMTLIARLCALCAVCSLMQMALPGGKQDALRVTAGLLMLHLAVSGMLELASQAGRARSLTQLFEALIR